MPSDLYHVFMMKMCKALRLCWMYTLSSPVVSAVTHKSPLFPCNYNLVPIKQTFPTFSSFLLPLPDNYHSVLNFHCFLMVCVRTRTVSMVLTWRSEDSLRESILSLLHMGTELGHQVWQQACLSADSSQHPTLIMLRSPRDSHLFSLDLLNFLLSLHNCPL